LQHVVDLLSPQAVRAIASWDRVSNSAEANVFILSLLMRKNWESGRA
jgi:hypothetical protein